MEKILERSFDNKKFLYIITVALVWFLLRNTLTMWVHPDNMIYATGTMNAFDSKLFQGNVVLAEGVITPRFFLDRFFVFLMKLNGGSWAKAVLFVVNLGIFIMSVAVVNTAYRLFEKYRLVYAMILAALIMISSNRLAGFALFPSNSISLGVSIALSLFSISFVVGEKKNFNVAYILMGFSTLWHIHEGVYGFAILLIFALLDTISKKKLMVAEHRGSIICIASVLLVILPNMLTDSTLLSNREFVRIYANIRHPHHLLPSSWGMAEILYSFLTILSLTALRVQSLYFYNKDKLFGFLKEMLFFIGAWILALLIMYVFTEIYPLAFVSTMMISKFFKYVVWISLLWGIQSVDDYLQNKHYVVASIILYYTLSNHQYNFTNMLGGCFLIIGFVIMSFYGDDNKTILKEKRVQKNKIKSTSLLSTNLKKLLPGALFLGLAYSNYFFGFSFKQNLILLAGLVLELLLAKNIVKHERTYLTLAVLASITVIFVSVKGYIDSDERSLLISTMGTDLYQLSEDFRSKTEMNEEFVGDPLDMNGVGWFQVASQRNCYVLYNNVPSSKSKVEEWYNRCTEISGLFEKEPVMIADTVEKIGVKYILIPSNYYEKIESVLKFKVFSNCSGDSYRIYELIEN